jgi:hypothetical protein
MTGRTGVNRQNKRVTSYFWRAGYGWPGPGWTAGEQGWISCESCLHSGANVSMLPSMGTPTQPVTLRPEQVAELSEKLAKLRHDTNNHLTLMSTALELIRRNPESAGRLAGTLSEQPHKIRDGLVRFSHELEALLGITRD